MASATAFASSVDQELGIYSEQAERFRPLLPVKRCAIAVAEATSTPHGSALCFVAFTTPKNPLFKTAFLMYDDIVKGLGLMDLDEIEAHAFVPEAFICTYRRPHLLSSLGCLAIATLALYFPVRHYMFFHTLGPATDSILQFDTIAYATPMFTVFGFLFLAWSVWFFLSSRNQSISLFHGVITWTGVTGRKRLQCNYAEVLTLSLRQSWHKNTYSCEVGTVKGPLRWDSSISSASSLLGLAKRLAQQNDLW